MKKYVLLLSFFLGFSSWAQKAEKFPLRKYKIATLSDSLRETSGLTFLQGQLYSFNDGGNPGEFYQISPETGKIIQKRSTNLINKDWEAITNDGEHLFLADFGNNAGKRRDLAIYEIHSQGAQIVKKIDFEYQDQKDFSPPYLHHDFDAEALIFLSGKLHIFTKKWATNTVSHYVLDPLATGKQSLENTETYNTGFVVTDAAYHQEKLYVVGYTRKGNAYMMIFDADAEGRFFGKTAQKYALGHATKIGQIEGIAVNEKGIYISNERFSRFIFHRRQSLYFIPFTDLP